MFDRHEQAWKGAVKNQFQGLNAQCVRAWACSMCLCVHVRVCVHVCTYVRTYVGNYVSMSVCMCSVFVYAFFFPFWSKCYVEACGPGNERCPIQRWEQITRSPSRALEIKGISRFGSVVPLSRQPWQRVDPANAIQVIIRTSHQRWPARHREILLFGSFSLSSTQRDFDNNILSLGAVSFNDSLR